MAARRGLLFEKPACGAASALGVVSGSEALAVSCARVASGWRQGGRGWHPAWCRWKAEVGARPPPCSARAGRSRGPHPAFAVAAVAGGARKLAGSAPACERPVTACPPGRAGPRPLSARPPGGARSAGCVFPPRLCGSCLCLREAAGSGPHRASRCVVARGRGRCPSGVQGSAPSLGRTGAAVSALRPPPASQPLPERRGSRRQARPAARLCSVSTF
ncbi:PREDICTED: uncharacterized protein LOC106146722 [Chinchilla lanigera]|uniref:uncharacterized protein LOC106146722 n=1 Tax=Chinchilla lanigera TaxID=34839 RepID=UPI000698E9BA|nr:PREDICTED: uncharacterized protein LOC106146722 [Chinchilla lanigera]